MASVRRTIPKITWGTGFANTIAFKYPLDASMASSKPREGFVLAQMTSGVADAWDTGHDQLLAGLVRWIPGETAGGITGWDGATGWRAFLEWARIANVFRFFPDAALGTFIPCYLVEPFDIPPELEPDMTRNFQIVIRSSDGSVFPGY